MDATDAQSESFQGDETLAQDVRNIIGGVVGLALIIVPVILIRKLARSIEESGGFQSLTERLTKY